VRAARSGVISRARPRVLLPSVRASKTGTGAPKTRPRIRAKSFAKLSNRPTILKPTAALPTLFRCGRQ